MSAPFTPEQEARLRQIIREEIEEDHVIWSCIEEPEALERYRNDLRDDRPRREARRNG